jgi:glycosidase
VDLDHGPGGKFTPRKWRMSDLKSVVEKWQHVMIYNGGWNALYLENHDQGRVISRFASDNPEWRALSSKMLATFLALQSGTVFVYQGQELAMKNVPAEWTIDDFRDIETLNHWHELLATYPDDKERQAVAMQEYRIKSRDNARTPMQWNKSAHAGFTTGEKPWINVHGDYETWNAETQVNQPDSVYHYWAKLLKLRLKLKDVIVYGDFIPVGTAHNDVFAYMRSTPGSEGAALVVANFRAEAVSWKVPTEVEPFASEGQKIIGNYETGPTISGGDTIELRPFEAVVYWTT